MAKKYCFILLIFLLSSVTVFLSKAEDYNSLEQLREDYRIYEEEFASIETVDDIAREGYEVVEQHSFWILLESFGDSEVWFLPAIEKKYHRMAVFIADENGRIIYKTNQLETNYKQPGKLTQPTKNMISVAFHDVNGDDLTDIIIITDCQLTTSKGDDKIFKVGDVLFQTDGGFYRDWRVSDKLNRFSMNKSVDYILAHVRDGKSTEPLYTASTLQELLNSGFHIFEEQCYYRSFEKQGYLRVVPGYMRVAEYDVFMIYLVNEQGYIVWSFQPMDDYDNLYALKGMACKDVDGDGMKDLVVLARYSYSDPDNKMIIDVKCDIYYQRTDGFVEDHEFSKYYQCTTEDTVSGLVEIIRNYWGWAN